MAGLKRLGIGFGLALAALQLPSCQFPNYNILPDGQGGSDGGAPSAGSGGSVSTSGRAGSSGAGGSDPPPLCDEGLSCQPAAPSGWLGPVAYWQGPSGEELPDCPEGYTEPTDLHADPEGTPADCSCTCTAMDLKCGEEEGVTVYNNLNCDNACATVGPQECTAAALNGCSGASVSIEAPLRDPTGRCTADVETDLPDDAGWTRDARFCELDTDVDECGAGQSCFPTPKAPFASQLCVYRVVLEGQAAPTCPEEYPNRELLYSAFTDERDCGECECEGPAGGSCTGEVIIATNSDCSAFEKYTIGAPCRAINKPSHLAVHYVLTPGSCGVGNAPAPIGEVVPSGNYHAVCCQ